jgi:hypothetical protein
MVEVCGRKLINFMRAAKPKRNRKRVESQYPLPKHGPKYLIFFH